MDELRALNDSNIFYDAYVLDNGKTFMHIAGATGERNPGDTIGTLDAFKKFKGGLEGNTVTSPQQMRITIVGTSDNP